MLIVKTVATEEALLQALRAQTDEIHIDPALTAKMQALRQAELSDTDTLGINVGSHGVLSIVTYGLNKLLHTFKGVSAADGEINERVLRLYKINAEENGTLTLRLKQLDY